jgi:hypothetical protein
VLVAALGFALWFVSALGAADRGGGGGGARTGAADDTDRRGVFYAADGANCVGGGGCSSGDVNCAGGSTGGAALELESAPLVGSSPESANRAAASAASAFTTTPDVGTWSSIKRSDAALFADTYPLGAFNFARRNADRTGELTPYCVAIARSMSTRSRFSLAACAILTRIRCRATKVATTTTNTTKSTAIVTYSASSMCDVYYTASDRFALKKQRAIHNASDRIARKRRRRRKNCEGAKTSASSPSPRVRNLIMRVC